MPPEVAVELAEVGPPAAQPPVPIVVKDEPLETKARQLSETVLDAAAKEAEKKCVAAELDMERKRAEMVAQRNGFRAYVAYWAGQGVRIFVELVENTVGLVADKVAAVFGGKKKGN